MPEKPSKLMPALYGGLIMGAISGLPVLSLLNCLCCAGILLGGFLSVMFYKNEFTPAMFPLTSSECMQVGAIAGLFGALFGTLLHLLTLATIGNVSNEMMLEMLRNFHLPQEALDQMERSIEQSAEMTTFSIGISLLTSLIIDPLFGLLGGLIGFSAFKSKQTPMNMPPSQPPPVQ
jgi:hypothetical protein